MKFHGGPLNGYDSPPEQQLPEDEWTYLDPDLKVVTYRRDGDGWHYVGHQPYENPIENPEPEPEFVPPELVAPPAYEAPDGSGSGAVYPDQPE